MAAHAPEPARIEAMLAAMRAVLAALVETPAVTLASVSGACLGGGAEIVAACDLVLVSEDARIGFPEIRLACFPPGAAVLLPLRLGEARATEWILTGQTYLGTGGRRRGIRRARRASRAASPRRPSGSRSACSRRRRRRCRRRSASSGAAAARR